MPGDSTFLHAGARLGFQGEASAGRFPVAERQKMALKIMKVPIPLDPSFKNPGFKSVVPK